MWFVMTTENTPTVTTETMKGSEALTQPFTATNEVRINKIVQKSASRKCRAAECCSRSDLPQRRLVCDSYLVFSRRLFIPPF